MSARRYVEVRPEGVSKGYFLEHVFTHLKSSNREPDFVLCFGDDVSDEPMFEVAQRVKDADEGIKVC
jgi:trehalose-phosphatase